MRVYVTVWVTSSQHLNFSQQLVYVSNISVTDGFPKAPKLQGYIYPKSPNDRTVVSSVLVKTEITQSCGHLETNWEKIHSDSLIPEQVKPDSCEGVRFFRVRGCWSALGVGQKYGDPLEVRGLRVLFSYFF